MELLALSFFAIVILSAAKNPRVADDGFFAALRMTARTAQSSLTNYYAPTSISALYLCRAGIAITTETIARTMMSAPEP